MQIDLAKTLARLDKMANETGLSLPGEPAWQIEQSRKTNAASQLRKMLVDAWRDSKLIALPDDAVEVAIAEGLIMELDMDEDTEGLRIERVATAIAKRVMAALTKGADHAG